MSVEGDANEVSKEVNVSLSATRFKVIPGAKSEPPPDPAPVSMRDLEGLFREHHDRVFRAAYRVTGSVVDAEDVLQTVFLRLSRRGDVNLEPNPGSYLHRAAINAALDLLRQRARTESIPIDDVAPVLAANPRFSPELQHRNRAADGDLSDGRGRLAASRARQGQKGSWRFSGWGRLESAPRAVASEAPEQTTRGSLARYRSRR